MMNAKQTEQEQTEQATRSKEAAADATKPTTFLWQRGFSIRITALEADRLKQYRAALTVQPKGHPDYPRPKPFQLYTQGKDYFRVPRHWGESTFGAPETNLLKSHPRPALEFEGPPLRAYQEPVINKAHRHLSDHGCGVMSLYTSWGKTFGALQLISRLKERAIILVHKSELLKQWKEEIGKCMPRVTIGVLKGSMKDISEDADIVLAMIQTVVNMETVPPVFGLSVVDECLLGEQRVLSPDGDLTMKDIYSRWASGKETSVFCLRAPSGERVVGKVTHAWERRPNHPLVHVQIEGAREGVHCTANHKWMTPSGWKEAGNLVSGSDLVYALGTADALAVPRRVVQVQPSGARPPYVYDISVRHHHNFIPVNLTDRWHPVVSNCHHIAAETFSTIFKRVTTKYALGLSATVQRKDGLTRVIHDYLGPLIVNVEADVGTRRASVRFFRYGRAPAGATHKARLDSIVTNAERNEAILAVILRLISQDPENLRKILILSDRRQQATWFHEKLLEHQESKSVGLFLGQMKSAVLEAEKEKDVICSSFTMFAEGLSVPKLNTLVLLTPKSDVCQVMGRIFRKAHVNVRPLILDIVDAGMENKMRNRQRTYSSQLTEMDSGESNLLDCAFAAVPPA
jgi:superfamily II DNA or RNA helicase